MVVEIATITFVPARVGGVDLSKIFVLNLLPFRRPRPCGRGGFKLSIVDDVQAEIESPPVWAGWI